MRRGARTYPAPGHDRPDFLSPLGRRAVHGASVPLDLLPLPARTLNVGGSASSERSETSSASASAMRRPALHCSSISSLALGLSVALMTASTSWASRYSGSLLGCADLSDVFGCAPRGRRLRATVWLVMVLPPSCKECSERFLQTRAFSSSLRRGPSCGGRSRMQEKWVSSCT